MRNNTGVICTIGPSSNDFETLSEMSSAGMDAARLNFSHGSHKTHLEAIKLISKLKTPGGRAVSILQDLEGYRIRVGKLARSEGIQLKKGEKIFLTSRPGSMDGDRIIPFDYEGGLEEIREGTGIFIDDGSISLRVIRSAEERIEAEVTGPGLLKSSKGVNMPGVELKFKGMKGKDREDIAFGLKHGVDMIAQSFVRGREDVNAVREAIRAEGADCGVVAKIECRQGIDNIDEIIEVSDGIMIARGDMGVSVPLYQIPVIQKLIIKKCNRKRKFVITATQMLESMTCNPLPTRAEVSDVANAVIDGADYLMLSGETAVGISPAGTVKMMRRIISYTRENMPSLGLR